MISGLKKYDFHYLQIEHIPKQAVNIQKSREKEAVRIINGAATPNGYEFLQLLPKQFTHNNQF